MPELGLYSFHNPSPSGEGHFSGLALHSEELGCSRVCAESWVLPSVIGPWAPRAGTDETGCVAYLHRSLPWSLLLSALPHPTLGPEERQGISPLSQRSLWNEQCPLPQTGAKDPPSAQYPCLRQGPRTPRVPSSMCSRQMPLKRSQCNNVLMREEACVFRFPHKSPRPRGQRPTICYFAEPPEVGGQQGGDSPVWGKGSS